MRYWIGNIECASTHWDCECEVGYIKNKEQDGLFCGECGSRQEDQPDSRAEEINCMETCHIDRPCPHGMDCDHEGSGRAQMWRDLASTIKYRSEEVENAT